MDLQAAYPEDVAIPTLDIDLAWHTHILSPKSYATWTTKKMNFIPDHSDAMDENQLSVAFEWTSKTYMAKYNTPYSECTCWYCESIRMMNDEKSTSLSLYTSNTTNRTQN